MDNLKTGQQVGASVQAIRHHYDVGNEFYRLWLDPTLTYSGALWDEGDTLETAQIRKMDHHIRESRAGGAARVLDIGCGWGGVLRRLMTAHNVGRAVGLTLSAAQAEWNAKNLPKGAEVRVEGWESHTAAEPYDAIISIGAFEHFARVEMSGPQRVAAYQAFFQRCHELLKPGGRLSLQTFAYGAVRKREQAHASPATQFLAGEIFPETDPPRLVEIAQAIEGSFEIERLRNDRLDYARTCKVWLENLRANASAATDLVGKEVLSRYERYLALSAIGFQTGRLDLYRITLRRADLPA
jgi:cyclopropane-fatty-acyl-phospholipid synthase